MPESSRAFVTPEWLHEHSSEQDVVTIDASLLRSERPDGRYLFSHGYDQFVTAGHIPDARHADLIEDFSDSTTGLPFTRPDRAPFQAATRALGINNRSTVVVYDRLNNAWAARFWLLLKSFGHERVFILNGGLIAWTQAGFALATGKNITDIGDFTAADSGSHFVDLAEVKSIVAAGDEHTDLVNVLNAPVFAGHEQHYARPGRIPGSVNDPFEELIDPLTNRIEPTRLRRPPESATATRVVAYCGGGIYAAGYAAAVYEAAAAKPVNLSVYDGSLTEWTTREPLLPLTIDPTTIDALDAGSDLIK